jgi:hypothetical protein
MKQVTTDVEEIDASELPVSGVVRVQRRTGYGTVADLEDEAPADIGELQRTIAYEMYGPIIDLPGRGRRLGHVVLDANGEVDWDAIGPAGGWRRRAQPAPDGCAGELRAELARTIGLIGLVKERVPGTAKYLVLKYVRMGILDVEHVTNHDLRELVKLEARARQLREQLGAVAVATGRYEPGRHTTPPAKLVRR